VYQVLLKEARENLYSAGGGGQKNGSREYKNLLERNESWQYSVIRIKKKRLHGNLLRNNGEGVKENLNQLSYLDAVERS